MPINRNGMIFTIIAGFAVGGSVLALERGCSLASSQAVLATKVERVETRQDSHESEVKQEIKEQRKDVQDIKENVIRIQGDMKNQTTILEGIKEKLDKLLPGAA